MIRPVIIGTVLGVLLMAPLAFGQRAAWEQLMASGNEFQAQGRYAEAVTAYRSASQQAEESGSLVC